VKVTIVRHGETEWNKIGRIQGQTDVPLNDYGRQVAKQTRQAYEKENIHYDVIYSSPLIRAYETARILADPGQEIRIDSRLKELSYGKYEGSDYHKLMAGEPELAQISNCFLAPQNYVPDPTGESFSQLFQRTRSFLEDLRKQFHNNESILVVCHGGTTRALLWAIQERDLSEFWKTRHKNLCHSILTCEGAEPFTIAEQAKYYYQTEEAKACQPGTPGASEAPL
jgi:probable phosphoglycerate mutase